MSLDELREEQKNLGYPKLGKNNPSANSYLFAIILGKIVQYTVLTLIGCICWNYLAPLFNLPKLYFLRMLALIILSEVFFVRGTQK